MSPAPSRFLEPFSDTRSAPPPVLQGPQGARVRVDDREKISFASNNYLGLADHPDVKLAAIRAVEHYGAGAGAARALSGNTPLHEQLERELSAFKGHDATLVFVSGFAANSGTIPALLTARDAVISDELNHGSIVDGCRLSSARKSIYRHCDMDDLEDKLKAAADAERRLIVTDAVFSMNGSLAPVPDIVALARRWDAAVMVDEAHATGVLGENGRGSLEHFGLADEVEVVMGTLGKALGSIGGYVTGAAKLVAHLRRTARTYLLTTALPPACVAAALEALRVMRGSPDLRERLWANTRQFRDGIEKLGFDTMGSQTPIVPILIGDDDLALRFRERLDAEGVYMTCIAQPYVPAGTSRLRAIVTAAHTPEDITQTLDVVERVGKILALV